jgi:hypothetical protein
MKMACCGSWIHGRERIIPHAIPDEAASSATVSSDDVPSATA